jgi:hypothetical protein
MIRVPDVTVLRHSAAVFAGEGMTVLNEVRRNAVAHNPTAVVTGARSQVEDRGAQVVKGAEFRPSLARHEGGAGFRREWPREA